METTILINLKEAELKDLIKEAVFEALNTERSKIVKEPTPETLMNIDEVCVLFNISRVTVHKWKKKGLIPFYKMNRKVYFMKTEVINAMHHKNRKMEV